MTLLHIYSNNVGLIHLIFSVLAVITGTSVLIQKKGTINHRKMGYLYTFSMIGVLVTSFFMYNLFGRFGIFHGLALVSMVTLLGGLLPMLLRKPKSYITMHYNFMFWSVFGLYGALIAEILVRIPKAVFTDSTPNSLFYNLIGVGVFFVMGLGYFIINKNRSNWSKFDKNHP